MDEIDQAAQLREVLRRNNEKQGFLLPPAVLDEIAEVERQNQFDDDRRLTQRAISDVVTAAATAMRLSGSGDG